MRLSEIKASRAHATYAAASSRCPARSFEVVGPVTRLVQAPPNDPTATSELAAAFEL